MSLGLSPVNEPLPSKVPTDIRPIKHVQITFMDGTSRDILVDNSGSEGFYKEEHISLDLKDHTVYIVNGKVRDSPTLEF